MIDFLVKSYQFFVVLYNEDLHLFAFVIFLVSSPVVYISMFFACKRIDSILEIKEKMPDYYELHGNLGIFSPFLRLAEYLSCLTFIRLKKYEKLGVYSVLDFNQLPRFWRCYLYGTFLYEITLLSYMFFELYRIKIGVY